MNPAQEYTQLIRLRRALIALNQEFMDLLVGDDGGDETKLQIASGFLLWEVDERIRGLKKAHPDLP